MNEQVNEQTTLEAQVVETNEDLGDTEKAVSLGKFKDVKALLNAYNSLRAEFTKRCQRISELEAKNSSKEEQLLKVAQNEKVEVIKEREISEQEKNEIVKEYLKNLLTTKSKAIIMDGQGVGITTPNERPKTLEQAGQLAREIL